MSLSDKIINGIMGTNIRTIKVSVEQLAQIVNETIIAATTNEEELRAIEKAIKGSHFFISGDWESSDGKFLFHISLYKRSLKHRTVWVKNLQTEEIFEWSGFSLGPFKRAMQPYLVNARMHPPISWYRDQIIQDAVNAMDGDPEEAQDPERAYAPEEMSESIPNETAFYEPFNKPMPMPRRQNPAVIGVITVVVLIVIGVAASMYEENMKEKQAARQKELEQEYQQALQQVYQQQDSSQNSQQQAGTDNLQGSGSSANNASSGYDSSYNSAANQVGDSYGYSNSGNNAAYDSGYSTYGSTYDDYNSTTNDYDTSGYDTSDYDDEESGDEDEYIFPDSDTTYLTKSDLKGMSADELNYAKNELYARHGRIFNREDLQEYFEDCSWYEGVYTADEWDSYGDSYFFNDVEMANRNLLVKTEKKRR
ncbi:MAG: YARHG domain-containing protein [Roseburia sp.]|nr:YARHG domain-containing protein [Roseburia sp.]